MREKKIYLDTNILSRIPDLKISEETADALARLAEIEGIVFVTSPKTKQEILKTPSKLRNSALQFVYALMSKIPSESIYTYHGGAIGEGAIGEFAIGGGETEIDALYLKLTAIFDDDDAEHIFQAIMAKCDYFLTFDKKTILNRASKYQDDIQNLCGNMKLVAPEDAVRLIESQN